MSLPNALANVLRFFSTVAHTLFHSWAKLRWMPSSKKWLIRLDERLRKSIIHNHKGKWVCLNHNGKTHEIWTVIVEGDKRDVIPIVAVHGMGGGSNMFLNNIDSFACERDVYLLDVPGFGLSCRPDFEWKSLKDGSLVRMNGDDVEEFYVEVLEKWFIEMGLDKVILMGHSYGAFICSLYCMSYHDRVQHLILAEPWGFLPRPKKFVYPSLMSRLIMSILFILYYKINVFTPLRALGPLGPTCLWYLRSDLHKRYTLNSKDELTLFNYFYACNAAGSPSGEVGFAKVSIPFAFACKPLLERVDQWSPSMGVTFIFGEYSWADSRSGFNTKSIRSNSFVDVQIVKHAGHHVHTDKPKVFNQIVKLIGAALDRGTTPDIQEKDLPVELEVSTTLRHGTSVVSQFLIYNREHNKDG